MNIGCVVRIVTENLKGVGFEGAFYISEKKLLYSK